MFLALILPAYALYKGLGVVGDAAKVVFGANVLANEIAVNKAEKSFSLGINPLYDEYKTELEEKQEKEYGHADYGHTLYQPFELFDHELPPSMKHLKGTWWLNSKELTELLLLMRKDGIISRQGEDWGKYKALVDRFKDDVNARQMLGELVHGGRVDYDELVFKNTNRSKDKAWQAEQLAKLEAAKAQKSES